MCDCRCQGKLPEDTSDPDSLPTVSRASDGSCLSISRECTTPTNAERRTDKPDGTHTASFSVDVGGTVAINYSTRNEFALNSVVAITPGGEHEDFTFFDDCQPWSTEGPFRPTMITMGRRDTAGCVESTRTWLSIAGDWAEERFECIVPKGSGVVDTRGRSGSIQPQRLERATALRDIAYWAVDDQLAEGAKALVIAPASSGQPEKQEAPDSKPMALFVAGAAIVLTCLAFSLRNR